MDQKYIKNLMSDSVEKDSAVKLYVQSSDARTLTNFSNSVVICTCCSNVLLCKHSDWSCAAIRL